MVYKQKYALIATFFVLSLPLLVSAQWLETTIAVGGCPQALVYNSTNNKVYCAITQTDSVTVIDGVTNSVITTITVGVLPWALVYNLTSNKVYCTNSGGDFANRPPFTSLFLLN